MTHIKFLIICIFIFSNTRAFSNENLHSAESYTCKELKNEAVMVLFKDVYAALLSEQQTVLYNLMCACADFSEDLATLAKLNSLFILQSAKIQGMTLGVINSNETLAENIELLRFLLEALVKIHRQYDCSLIEVEQLYQQADPIVQEIFRDLCNTIYEFIDEYVLFSNQLAEIENQNSNIVIHHINDLLRNTPSSINKPLHHQIIDKQSNLTITLYQRAYLNWQTAQLYFDMLNMYVNLLDTYRTTVEKI